MFTVAHHLNSFQLKQHLSGPWTPLQFNRGLVRDTSGQRRTYAATSMDKLQTASDVQRAAVLSSLHMESTFQAEMDVDTSDDDSGTESESEDDQSLLLTLSACHLLRAQEQLLRPQPLPVRPVLPKFNVTIDHYTDDECDQYFRMKKENLRRMFNAWNVPETFWTNSRSRWTGEAAFLMYLRRLCALELILSDVNLRREMGGKCASQMSEICNTFQKWLYQKIQSESLMSGNLDRWASQLPTWARAIRAKAGPYDMNQHGVVCMFLDGTFIRVQRPGGWTYLQKVLWTRYKKSHGVGILVVIAPNGMIIDFW
jgi:hypothetical protein